MIVNVGHYICFQNNQVFRPDAEGIEMTSLLNLRYLSANKQSPPDLPALSPQQLYTA